MGSGAPNPFLANDKCQCVPMKPPTDTGANTHWSTAGGADITADGRKHVTFLADDGEERTM